MHHWQHQADEAETTCDLNMTIFYENDDRSEVLGILPWSPTKLEPQHSFQNTELVVASRSRPNDVDWNSSSSSQFQGSAIDDRSFSFEEPCFHQHSGNLKSARKSSPRTHPSHLKHMNKDNIKVRSGDPKNMVANDKEIKDLFSQWKNEHKKPTQQYRDNVQARSPLSRNSSKVSPPKKAKLKLSELSSNYSGLPSFDIDQVYAKGKSSPLNLSPRKKKVAVKLRAADLNISDGKKREIEEKFRKWQVGANEPISWNGFKNSSGDTRWTDSERNVSRSRPKPASRQPSDNFEPIIQHVQKQRTGSRKIEQNDVSLKSQVDKVRLKKTCGDSPKRRSKSVGRDRETAPTESVDSRRRSRSSVKRRTCSPSRSSFRGSSRRNDTKEINRHEDVLKRSPSRTKTRDSKLMQSHSDHVRRS